MTRAVVGGGIVLCFAVAAFAQNRPIADLKDAPPAELVTTVNSCRGEYEVALGDGSARRFKEIRSRVQGRRRSARAAADEARPGADRTVGDRAFVVFADLDELRRPVKADCRN